VKPLCGCIRGKTDKRANYVYQEEGMKIDEYTEVAIAKDGMWVELKPEDIPIETMKKLQTFCKNNVFKNLTEIDGYRFCFDHVVH
jgi:hypothetical protein